MSFTKLELSLKHLQQMEQQRRQQRRDKGFPGRGGFFAKNVDGIIIEYKSIEDMCNALETKTLGNYTVPEDANQPQ